MNISLRNLTSLLALALATAAPAFGASLQLIDSVNFRERQARPLDDNVLKLFGTAVDATRNRVYVAGIMSPAIGVLDGAQETWTRTVASGIEGFALKYIEVDPVANRLYVSDASHSTLRSIDLTTGAVAGPVTIATSMARPVADTRRGMVYLTQPSSPTFRAYNGADLSLAYGSDAMGSGAAHALWDAASDRVYVLDGSATGTLRIFAFDPASRAVASTLTTTLPAGQRPFRMAYDSARQRFFVVTGAQVLAVSASGAVLGQMPLSAAQDTQDIAFDPDRNEVAVLVLDRPANGTQAESGGHLLFFDGTRFMPLRDLPLSKKPHAISYDAANQRFYLAESDASTVWSVAGGGAELHGLRLGDSAEMITLAHGGETLYVTSRLGGSYLLEWQAATSSLQSFTAGFWPVPTRSDDSGNTLYVLNAWDSTLSVFDLTHGRTLSATIALGLVKGTTDRLPDLAIDSTRQRAYAAYPEFGQIAVVDLAHRVALTPISVPAYPTGDTGGGPGQLQVRVVPSTGRLFAYWQARSHLTVWDVSGAVPALLLDRNLSGMPTIDASLDQLFVDAQNSRVYAGPMEIDGMTGQSTGRMLARGDRVIGVDEASGVLWASVVETVDGVKSDVVSRLDRASLALIDATVIGAVPPVMNTQYAIDAKRARLYAADGHEAVMRVFHTGAEALPARVTSIEFYHSGLNHYFMTADNNEAKAVDRGAAGSGWVRTGYAFYAYPAGSAVAGAHPVCRFYGTAGSGPNSHFYTASDAECQAVKNDSGWTYEGIAFSIPVPQGSSCAESETPVFRAYNNRWPQNDSNHRYTADTGVYAQMTALGWAGEGVVFCAPR